MAYATWFIGSTAITSAAGFGLTGGYWIKMPDSFPPIQYIQTTSLAKPTSGDYRGLVITVVESTTTVSHIWDISSRGVEEYVKGDRWFRARSDPALSNRAGWIDAREAVKRVSTKIELYYRDQSEGGDIP